jgi:hypothetical protein
MGKYQPGLRYFLKSVGWLCLAGVSYYQAPVLTNSPTISICPLLRYPRKYTAVYRLALSVTSYERE